jgi:DNA-directed RNA polymerase subunit M/transcription elongation factor TFIIS
MILDKKSIVKKDSSFKRAVFTMSSDFIDSLLSSDREYSDLSTLYEDTSWASIATDPQSNKDPVSVYTQTTGVLPIEKTCPECQQLFVSFKGMRQHMAKTHAELQRTASCPVCGNMFRHKYAVNFHVKQVHSKATRVQCPFCNKEIYNKYVLKKHTRNYHSV